MTLDMQAYVDAPPEEKVAMLTPWMGLAATSVDRLGGDRDALIAAAQETMALLAAPVTAEAARAASLTLRLALGQLLTVPAADEPHVLDALRRELAALQTPRDIRAAA